MLKLKNPLIVSITLLTIFFALFSGVSIADLIPFHTDVVVFLIPFHTFVITDLTVLNTVEITEEILFTTPEIDEEMPFQVLTAVEEILAQRLERKDMIAFHVLVMNSLNCSTAESMQL